jgi:hypothetical protein
MILFDRFVGFGDPSRIRVSDSTRPRDIGVEPAVQLLFGEQSAGEADRGGVVGEDPDDGVVGGDGA